MEDVKCCRELTLEEEIKVLDIDEITKERLLKKCYEYDKFSDNQAKYLTRCHYRIDELERALIEQACDFGTRLYNLRREVE